MTSADRIRSQRHVTCMAALDTMDAIAERITKLLSYGRRISMTRRYTYTGHAPELLVGLSIDEQGHGGGILYTSRPDSKHLGVSLKPGIHGFGIGAYSGEGNDTEKEAWARYHAADDSDVFRKRRNMTVVTINGGMPGDGGPGRDDALKIEHWNEHGVCDERVIGFDTDAYWAERRDQ